MSALTLDGVRYPFSAFEDNYYWDEAIPACPGCAAPLRFEDDEACRMVPVDYRRETGWQMELRCVCGWVQKAEA